MKDTPEQQAIRQLEREVAEEVMGWREIEPCEIDFEPRWRGQRRTVKEPMLIPCYARSEDAAFTLVEKLKSQGASFACWETHRLSSVLREATAAFVKNVYPPVLGGPWHDETAYGSAWMTDRMAEAIARAALAYARRENKPL